MNTILVVEDDQDIRNALVEILESEKFEAVTAGNGEEALQYLRKSESLPKLVLLDIMMPVKDGTEFLREQKEDPRIADIPVVVMSADGRGPQRLAEFSPKDYLKKPLDLDNLLTTIHRLLNRTLALGC